MGQRARSTALCALLLVLAAACALMPAASARAETQTAPKITKQPAAATVEEGQSVTFESTASGNPTPTVQWEVSTNGGTSYAPIEGATATKYTIPFAHVSESASKFRAVFTNVVGKLTSSAVALTVHKIPTITKQPQPATVEEGQSATFEAADEGAPTPTVVWEVSSDGGTTWTGAGSTTTKITIANTKTSYSGRLYRATFRNSVGTTSTETAVLTVRKAPAVTKQPASTTVEAGQTATFEATGSGFPAPGVQWEVSSDSGASWSAIEGATSNQLTIIGASLFENGNEYRAAFTNPAGTAISSPATLTVDARPQVTQNPSSVVVEEGLGAGFEAVASGSPTPTIQWELSTNGGSAWSAVAGATANQLTISATKASENGNEYRATFKNSAGSATSAAATLEVRATPVVTKQPSSSTVLEGQAANFEAAASGSPAPTVQWEVSSDTGATWTAISGATSPKLTIAGVSTSESGNEYRAVFTNVAGQATTEAATLTVHAPPAITEQPESKTVEAGTTATFNASATGSPAPTVQWQQSTNGGTSWTAIPGATSTELTIAGTTLSENGYEYRVVFTNVAGTATSGAATLTVAGNHYAAVAWGLNTSRQLGNGSLDAFEDLPVGVAGLKFVEAVSAGGEHSLALLANGTVMSWGSNVEGQLGDGTNATRDEPVQVTGLSGVKAIAAGGAHSLALLTNGTVMAWGSNEAGQLGDGNFAESTVPVAVKGLTNVKAIAAGASHSLALLSNGTMMAWGDNTEGELGTGTLKSSDVPVAVKGVTSITAIAAGNQFSLALNSKGGVDAWGDNEEGELGNLGAEEEPFSTSPVSVGNLTTATAIAAGNSHGLALLSSGTVDGWGADGSGQVGNGVIESRAAQPVAVSGLSGVTAIAAGGADSAARLGTGRVMAWGSNKWGTLGDGKTGSASPLPVSVEGIAQVAAVSVGGFHVLAFGEPTPAVTEVTPSSGPSAGGTSVTITGGNLEGASEVKFGATAASSFTVNSPTSITATAPAGTGVVDVTVTTPSGTSPKSSADRYSYVKAPTITSLKPKNGPIAGGTSVVIAGTELALATSVRFGSQAASFKATSNTSITAIAPPGSVGVVDVSISTPGGNTATTTKDHYSYNPVIEAITPDTGSIAGGEEVTITGTGFALGSTATVFKFGTKKATSVSCTTTTTCTMRTPAQTATGTVGVIATVNKVNSPKTPPATNFTYS
ncbi:MAG TPA: immunoglobulin domain-containing protein [Solirubrobacteraceae bacterium]|nr:immunoglobulin domain-containing protein [Solirubrobacteraceae bacterium]